jgi:hypothetical protein
MSTKLFSVTTMVHKFDGFKDVAFGWFHSVEHNGPPRPYVELILGYDQLSDEDRCWPEQHVDELFTEQEALKAYLDANYGDAHHHQASQAAG